MKRPFILMRNSMLKAQWLLASLVLGLALAPTLAEAISLVPGGTGAPDAFSLGYSSEHGSTVVARTSGTLKTTWNAGLFSGGFYMEVETDPGNVFCSGCLDFIFQFGLDFPFTQNITSVALAGFSGYQTDVGYDVRSVGDIHMCGPNDNGFCNSGSLDTVPTNVYRSLDGNTVGFDFPGVTPDSTVDLVIETDATIYTDPLITVYGSNGGLATLPGFGPAGPPFGGTPVPEPSSLLLLGAGLAGLGLWGWKKEIKS